MLGLPEFEQFYVSRMKSISRGHVYLDLATGLKGVASEQPLQMLASLGFAQLLRKSQFCPQFLHRLRS